MTFTFRCALCALLLIAVSGAANAALLERKDSEGNIFAYYDDEADLTWLADANYAKTSGYDSDGKMTWSEANSWANNLIIGGYEDWRLPHADPSCGSTYNCANSEMGSLFYTALGGKAQTGNGPDFSPFTNVQYGYWSDRLEAPSQGLSWTFGMVNGPQSRVINTEDNYFAWAVRSGDGSAVPVPAAVWLFGSGLLSLFGLSRRRSAHP